MAVASWSSKLFRNVIQSNVSKFFIPTRQRSLYLQPSYTDPGQLSTEKIEDMYATGYGLGIWYHYDPESFANIIKGRQQLVQYMPKSIDELPVRRMKDSFITSCVALETNLANRERYIDHFNGFRFGQLMNDLDVFAVWIAKSHVCNPKAVGKPNPYTVVTALVDTLHVSKKPISVFRDIRLSGHCASAGKSSMECAIIVEQKDDHGQWEKITDCIFVMVALDPAFRPAVINKLVCDTPEEQAYVDLAEQRIANRKKQAKESVFFAPPNDEERKLIHSLCFGDDVKVLPNTPLDKLFNMASAHYHPSKALSMGQCKNSNLVLCHPQNRNMFNKVFGGFLMGNAYELAFSTCLLHTGAHPKIINIGDISFNHPVEIGSLLRFESQVAYIEKNYVHIPVTAEVLDSKQAKRKLTNVFHFTFQVPAGKNIRPVVPNSYQETVVFLDARRHFKDMFNDPECRFYNYD